MTKNHLIANFPLFSQLNANEIDELIKITKEVHYKPGDPIVKEGDFIDGFFLICQGKAEVRQKKISGNNTEYPIIAILEPGEPIGLNEKGTFSATQRRTATVIALTDITLLRIDISSLNEFIKNHPSFNKEIEKNIEKMVKIDFIKKTYPFVYLNNDEIDLLMQEIKEVTIPPDTVILKEGDIADHCYLIEEGEVEIFQTQEDNTEKKLCILKSAELIGEAGLLAYKKRTASARSISECKLLILESSLFVKLMKTSKSFSKSLMGIMVNRFSPIRIKEVTAKFRTTNDGQKIVMLHNTKLHQYYRLSEEGWFIWEQLDGSQTIQDITINFFKKYRAFVPEMICNLLYTLAETGFVIIPSVDTNFEDEISHNFFTKIKNKIRKITQIEFNFTHTDELFTKIYQNGIFILYKWPLQLIFLLVGISGIIAFFSSYQKTIYLIEKTDFHPLLFILLIIPVSIINVILHESGHAFTAKRFGYSINRVGISWFWLGPIAFVDTSELWLADRIPRLAVDISGVYVDFIVGGCLSLLALVLEGELSVFVWLFSFLFYYNAFKNLNPIREYDGYYIVSELLNKNKLRKSSIYWIANTFPKLLKNPSMKIFKKHIKEFFYWVICILYLVGYVIITFFVLQLIFKLFSFHYFFTIPTYYISLILAATAFILSVLSIWREIKQYIQLAKN